MAERTEQKAVFENLWMKDSPFLKEKVSAAWREQFSMKEEEVLKRLDQLVFAIHNEQGVLMGVSTAYKAYIKQFKNNFYAVRFMILPQFRIPGLLPQLVQQTREFLESLHEEDSTEKCIGLIALIENEEMKRTLRAPILPSGFVYLGNSAAGHHIRVYYFRGARIIPQ